jgi:hypothetical protein
MLFSQAVFSQQNTGLYAAKLSQHPLFKAKLSKHINSRDYLFLDNLYTCGACILSGKTRGREDMVKWG